MIHRPRHPASRRRGYALLAVLVCVIVITLLMAALVRLAHAQRGRAEAAVHAIQAEWLAEAGIERAAARLRGDRDYKGETWSINAAEMGGHWPGRVAIKIDTAPDAPRRRRIKVQADYPPEVPLRARYSKQVVIDLGSESREG